MKHLNQFSDYNPGGDGKYSYEEINKIVVGVQSKSQLIEVMGSISEITPASMPKDLSIDDPMLLSPKNWNL